MEAMDFVSSRRTTCGTSPAQRACWLSVVALGVLGITSASAQATPNTAKAWGSNQNGQLGVGAESPEECGPERTPCSDRPLPVSGLSGASALAGGGAFTGEGFSLALLEGGTVDAWGANGHGQLGDGTTTARNVPVTVSGLGEVQAIAAGGQFSLALQKSGKVMAWGINDAGQLGDGSNVASSVPVEVTGLSEEVVAIAAGGETGLAVLRGGRVMAWGKGNSGQLGDGITEASNVPVLVCAVGAKGPCPSGPYLEGVKAVAASNVHSLALLSNGTVVAWGSNGRGELGNGSETETNVPVAVSGLGGVAAIAAGGELRNEGEPFSVALLEGGTVDTWGSNAHGGLGVGSSTGPEQCTVAKIKPCSRVPVAVSGLSGVTAIAARGGHAAALLKDGTVEDWGENGFGQLGDETSVGPEACGPGTCSAKPVAVSALAGAKGIGAGGFHTLAFGPPPAVTKVTVKRGPAGTTIGIVGTDFTAAAGVEFGSTPAASFEVVLPTLIFAKAPAEPVGPVNVTVTTGWGTSATSTADQFTIVPGVTSVSPNSGAVTGGTSVTIKGSGFVTGTSRTAFSFGGRRATSVSCASTSECTLVTPAHAAGTIDVRAIVSKLGSPRNRPGDQFTYS